MKITISKNTLSTAVTESAQIYSAIDPSLGGSIAAMAPIASDLIRAEFSNLKHFSSTETDEEFTLVINDEVLIKAIRMYANIARLVMPVFTSVCALIKAFMPAFQGELRAYEKFAMEPKVTPKDDGANND
jgi:hypothetical protein